MDRSDVSFTFLDRIREIEENIEDGRFQSRSGGPQSGGQRKECAMDRSDVSFTFLDRIREIEENIEDGRFQSALAQTGSGRSRKISRTGGFSRPWRWR